jgi:hypothetical protein
MDGAREGLKKLHWLYCDLLEKGLLLRGAMVYGQLEFEPRITIRNYQKMLPQDDTLARAVGLKKTVKGTRLLILIEPASADRLLRKCEEWLTQEGYVRHIDDGEYGEIPLNDISAEEFACPPAQDAYECLYGWPAERTNAKTRGQHEDKKAGGNYVDVRRADCIALQGNHCRTEPKQTPLLADRATI